jgi:hypothetical protein
VEAAEVFDALDHNGDGVITRQQFLDGVLDKAAVAELQGLKLRELRKRAKEAGVSAEALEAAMDDDEPEAAVIAMLVAAGPKAANAGGDTDTTPTYQDVVRRSSSPWRPLEVHRAVQTVAAGGAAEAASAAAAASLHPAKALGDRAPVEFRTAARPKAEPRALLSDFRAYLGTVRPILITRRAGHSRARSGGGRTRRCRTCTAPRSGRRARRRRSRCLVTRTITTACIAVGRCYDAFGDIGTSLP